MISTWFSARARVLVPGCRGAMTLIFMAFVVAITLCLGDLTRSAKPRVCTLEAELMGSLYVALGILYYMLYKLVRGVSVRVLGGTGVLATGAQKERTNGEQAPGEYDDVTCFVIQEEGVEDVCPPEQDCEDRMDRIERPEYFDARKVWTNVYGLGVVTFLAMIKLQHDRMTGTSVLCLALGSAGAWEERRGGTCAFARNVWLFVACMSALGACALASADELSRGVGSLYDTAVLSTAIPLGIVGLLKLVRPPDNMYETLEVSLPCTGMMALMVLVLTFLYERPCYKNMILVGDEVDDHETVTVVNGRLLLGGALNPIPCGLTVAVLVSAVLERRSLDACCVLIACASLRGCAVGGHCFERPLRSAGCLASVTSLVALLLYRWDRRDWARCRERAVKKLLLLREMRRGRSRPTP